MVAALYFTHLEIAGNLNVENLKEAETKAEMAQHRADAEAEEAAMKAKEESDGD